MKYLLNSDLIVGIGVLVFFSAIFLLIIYFFQSKFTRLLKLDQGNQAFSKKRRFIRYLSLTFIIFSIFTVVGTTLFDIALEQGKKEQKAYDIFFAHVDRLSHYDCCPRYDIVNNEIIETIGGHKRTLFTNVTGISQAFLGPDKQTLHLRKNQSKAKSTKFESNLTLCLNLKSSIHPVEKDVSLRLGEPQVLPPYNYSKFPQFGSISTCGSVSAFIPDTDYYSFLKTSHYFGDGTLYIKNLQENREYTITLDKKVMKKLHHNEETDVINALYFEGPDAQYYFYPYIGRTFEYLPGRLVMTFGYTLLNVDLNTQKVTGFINLDDISTILISGGYFYTHKNLPLIVIEDGWESTHQGAIIDLSEGVRVVDIKNLNPARFKVFDTYDSVIYDDTGIILIFPQQQNASFHEDLAKVDDEFACSDKTGRLLSESEMKVKEANLKIRYPKYLDIRCSMCGMAGGCTLLSSATVYRFEPGWDSPRFVKTILSTSDSRTGISDYPCNNDVSKIQFSTLFSDWTCNSRVGEITPGYLFDATTLSKDNLQITILGYNQEPSGYCKNPPDGPPGNSCDITDFYVNDSMDLKNYIYTTNDKVQSQRIVGSVENGKISVAINDMSDPAIFKPFSISEDLKQVIITILKSISFKKT